MNYEQMYSSAHQRNVQRTVQSMQSGYSYGQQQQMPVSPYEPSAYNSMPGYRQPYGMPRTPEQKMRYGQEVTRMTEADGSKFQHLRYERMKLAQNFNQWFPLVTRTRERIRGGFEKETATIKKHEKHLKDVKKKITAIDEKLCRICKRYGCSVETNVIKEKRRVF